MLSSFAKMPIWLGDPEAAPGCLVIIRGDLLTWGAGDLSFPGVETPGNESELVGEAGFCGDA